MRFQLPQAPARSVSYKTCLIVLNAPRRMREAFLCEGRLLLGGRMQIPLPPVQAPEASLALDLAEERARSIVDSLEAGAHKKP